MSYGLNLLKFSQSHDLDDIYPLYQIHLSIFTQYKLIKRFFYVHTRTHTHTHSHTHTHTHNMSADTQHMYV